MGSAGRILIMPKGKYDANTEYGMLDLVSHSGTSWLAKKNGVIGIEPSETNEEYWFKMFDSDGLFESITAEQINALDKADLGKATHATDLLAQYDTPTFVRWTSATLNTPYKNNLTKHMEGFALVSGNPTTYHTIVTWTKGGSTINFWIHQINNGVSLGWGTFLLTSGGKLTGDLIIEKSKPLVQLINTESGRTSNFGSVGDGLSTIVGTYKASDDQTNLLIRRSVDGLENILRVSVDGKDTYKVFGEHNIANLLSAISGAVGGVKIATGEYTGNGDYGSNNGNPLYTVINPGFEAKILLITTEETDATYDSPTIWVKGMKQALRKPLASDDNQFIYFTENGNEVKLYNHFAPYFQHNRKDAKYRWLALG